MSVEVKQSLTDRVEKLISITDNSGYKFVAVRVTAADYNGINFDGNPFAFTCQKSVTRLTELFNQGRIAFTPKPEADYGIWALRHGNDRVQELQPGDVIIFKEDGTLFPMVHEAVSELLIVSTHSDVIDLAGKRFVEEAAATAFHAELPPVPPLPTPPSEQTWRQWP